MPIRSPASTLVFTIFGVFGIFCISGLFGTLSEGRAAPSDPGSARADFSGAWKLNEALSADPSRVVQSGGGPGGERTEASGRTEGGGGGRRGGGGRGGGGGGRSGGGGNSPDFPFEAMEAEGRLVLTDNGETVKVDRVRGPQRVFRTDGEERELDDGEGPALLTAKRKGSRGETIAVSSKWPSGRHVQETWELLSNPRRLAVTIKVSSRRSFTIKRIYDPAPMTPPGPAPAPQPAAAAAPIVAPNAVVPAAPAAPAVSPPASAGLRNCSIRPPKGAGQTELARLARVSQSDAEKRVLAFVAPRKPTSIISSDVEVDEGCLVWTYDLRFPEKQGVEEVVIDAGDGKVLSFDPDAGKAN